eukprot:scaffold7349_cov173-Amphora_coffeaeformis.AAC.14
MEMCDAPNYLTRSFSDRLSGTALHQTFSTEVNPIGLGSTTAERCFASFVQRTIHKIGSEVLRAR